MTKHPEIYYYLDEMSSVFYWTEIEDYEGISDLIFVGSSLNPNKSMAVAAFVKGTNRVHGYKIKPLP